MRRLEYAVKIRITPAGAGKTKAQYRKEDIVWDHPRRCGENIDGSSPLLSRLGSPPQVRGKPSLLENYQCFAWITPAGAGKTRHCCQCLYTTEDHPRRCGENRLMVTFLNLKEGSPPQVRGKLSDILIFSVISGITPAGAGKTTFIQCLSSRSKDHPRRCGENDTWEHHPMVDMGSPPQVRGKRSCGGIASIILRITPAGAGKTGVNYGRTQILWDHPRRCGENYVRGHKDEDPAGSPPQVRGKRR